MEQEREGETIQSEHGNLQIIVCSKRFDQNF